MEIMKKLLPILTLLILLTPSVSAQVFTEVQKNPSITTFLVGYEIPNEVIFVKSTDTINLYDINTKEFIMGIQLEDREINKILEKEKTADIKAYASESAVINILNSRKPIDTTIEEKKKGKLEIEPTTIPGKIKYGLFITGLTISRLW
tara:strand:+ start:9976 stop:10419 length:444 start_codon:yes stop_codon:yes gene_type:complete